MILYFNKIIVAIKCYRALPAYLKFLRRRLFFSRPLEKNKPLDSQKSKKIDPNQLFLKNRSLKNHANGYWYLNPSINLDELNDYYSQAYWKDFKKGIYHNVNTRDLDHYNLIMKHSNGFFNSKKTILNFGSGHLGCSFLFYFSGHKVVNLDLEPASTQLIKNSNDWINIKNLDDLNCEIDFLYSSHSLEHVQSITSFEKKFFSKIKSGGYLFFEVPNEKKESVKIHIPHTYYFRKDYFNQLNFNKIFCETYNIDKFPNKKSSNGDIIRYLAKK